ncbi:hypothetical protein [Trinickia sp. EG282A]|uniref:hypothetical protein n=1 Tax=Trinickia sp. EG282A TaxID=3237013 RepID=UPI0034D1AD12
MYGDVLDLVRKIRRSEGFKYFVGTPARLAVHTRQRLNKDVFSIDIYEVSGFFSVLQMVLFVLMHCETKHLTPRISARGKIYGDPDGKVDWFSELFETVQKPRAALQPGQIRTSKVNDLVHLGLRNKYEKKLRIESASKLFLSHYRPAAHIAEEVAAISQALELGESTLAVHYRGTDKRLEAETISWERFCTLVASVLDSHPHLTSIFISSDEPEFIDYFLDWPFGVCVKVAPAKYLASGNVPVHFAGYPGLEIAREALLTCLLLSNCGFLVKTPSYLSAWSKIFNPALPVVLASPPRRDAFWFPDSELWTEAAVHAGAAGDSIGEEFVAAQLTTNAE